MSVVILIQARVSMNKSTQREAIERWSCASKLRRHMDTLSCVQGKHSCIYGRRKKRINELSQKVKGHLE